MRIAIGQLWQETNTLNPLPTTRAEFDQFGVLRGNELLERLADTNEVGGFIQALRAWPERPQLLGLVRLAAWPSGRATQETCAWILREFEDSLQAHLPVDAVLLALHGALAADGTPDVTGKLLQAVRRAVGPAIPIVATLDLHANVTRKMVEAADVLVLYHTAPHIDVFETGQRGAAILRRIRIERERPVTALVKLPLVVPAERANTQDPASVSHAFRLHLEALERDPRILSAGLATVQPWLDVPELGGAVLVTAHADGSRAQHEAETFAAEVWRQRAAYLPELTSVEEAVRAAHRSDAGLVVLCDSADATTSGAPGDSTWILGELLRYEWPRPALVPIVAPEVVEEAARRGAAAELTVSLGGRRDTRYARKLTLTATVETLFSARFVMSGHLARNLAIDMGPAAVLRTGNVHIVATSRSGPHFAPELFQAAGLDPFAAAVLVAKSPCGFRAAYAPRARNIILVRAPGCAPSDFWHYDYRSIPRPLWPWDDMPSWQPRASLHHAAGESP